MAILKKLTKLLFAIFLIPFMLGYAEEFYNVLLDLMTLNSARHKILLAGMAIYLICYFVYFNKSDFFYETLEHELTHLLFAKLFFKRTGRLLVTSGEGGHVTTTGNNFIIALSPYFFPTLTYFILILGFLVKNELFTFMTGLAGLSLGYHVISTAKELRPRQTDIKNQGYIFSGVFIVLGICLFYGAALEFALNDIDAVKNYLTAGYERSREWLVKVGD